MGTRFTVANDGSVTLSNAINLSKNQALNLVVHKGTSFPSLSGSDEGFLFYRTDLDQLNVYDGSAFKQVGGGGGVRVYCEKVNETPNGVIILFTVDNAYVPNTTMVTRNGVLLERNVDYTEQPSSKQITFIDAPATDSIILVSYSITEGTDAPVVARQAYEAGTASGTYTGSLTVFNLPFSYTVGSNSLFVYSAGTLQRVGVSNDYVETDTSTVTFNSARSPGEIVTFIKFGVATDALHADTHYYGGSDPLAGELRPTNLYPSSGDGTGELGSESLRWNLVRAVTVAPGDLKFDNGWVITEGDKIGKDPEGLFLVSPSKKVYKFQLIEVE